MVDTNRELIRKELRTAVKSAVYTEAAKLKPEDFKRELLSLAAEQRKKIIYGLLGMDTSWGRVELYKTNGHVTQIQSWIMEAIGPDLEDFIKSEAKKIFKRKNSTMRKDLQVVIEKEVNSKTSAYELRNSIRSMVDQEISGMSKDLFKEVLAEILPVDGNEVIQEES